MSIESPPPAPHQLGRILLRKEVLAGLMFIAIAALGLWLSHDYPIGTAQRMSTGYMPRLLCWLLMGLGAVVVGQGLYEYYASEPDPAIPAPPAEIPQAAGAIIQLRAIVMAPLSLIAFAIALEPLGLILAILILVVVASLASNELKPWETLAAAAGLCVLSWAIFVRGLGLTISVLPDW